MYKLSKKCIWGGLYLVNTKALLLVLASYNETHAENEDISDQINLFNNISWRIIANNKIVDADKNSWITKQKYNESIVKVIAKAVADCITDKNEFANKGEGDVITFNVDAKTYSAKNWNAVVLWNYLHILKCDYLKNVNRNQDEIFKELKTRICNNYPSEGVSNLAGEIDKAIVVIQDYDKALSLKAEMKKFNQVYKDTQGAKLETIIENNTRITPIADLKLAGPKQKDEITATKEDIAHIYALSLQNLTIPNFNPNFNNIFTPIKIKMDSDLYFVNEYRIWLDLKDYLGTRYYDIGEITKNENLLELQHPSDRWDKYYLVDNPDIIKKIESKISMLFEGLALARTSS